jgi:hypothetical protein
LQQQQQESSAAAAARTHNTAMKCTLHSMDGMPHPTKQLHTRLIAKETAGTKPSTLQ